MEQINKLFVQFLKDNNAFKQYVKNLKLRKCYFQTWENYTNPFTICLLGSTRPSNFIIGSFLWANTLEGHDFWKNLDDKWKKQFK